MKLYYKIPLVNPHEKKILKAIPGSQVSQQQEDGSWQAMDFYSVTFRNHKQTFMRLNPAIKKLRVKLKKAKIKYSAFLHYEHNINWMIIQAA